MSEQQNRRDFRPREDPITDAPTAFLINPANASYVAGTRRSLPREGEGCMFLVALVFLTFGSVFFAFVGREWVYWGLIKYDGGSVDGRVTGLSANRDSDGDTFQVKYEFNLDGTSRAGKSQIGEKVYSQLREGGPVAVRYCLSNPAYSRARDGAWMNVWALLGMTAFLALWSAIPTALLIGSVRGMIHRRRLIRDGRLLPGQIVASESSTDSDGDLRLKLKYRFTAPSGRSFEGEGKRQRNDLKGAQLPSPGEAVHVLYASDKIHRIL